ncbi:unnamed protein product [Microthlaspi erraticum]|uniref:Retrotransposon Copia-like N-terminal domain-containing protein n=1 Tax=Microthlaspi erraticum TaxID=1685480 RepID=A0A6D2IM19_9BRAS|nr:unnamed protein product [Microthlaspi erraticum]
MAGDDDVAPGGVPPVSGATGGVPLVGGATGGGVLPTSSVPGFGVASASGARSGEVRVVSPYTLYSSDNPGATITPVLLNGENYNEWSLELVNALQAKRKTGYVNGSLPKPALGSPDLENWLVVNSMIVGWICASIEPKVRSTVTYISDAFQFWENLKQHFSVGNKVRVHQIKVQLASCRQDGQSVLDYYGRLSKLWEKLQMYQPIHGCVCGAEAKMANEKEEEKIHQFLMGLDDSRFGNICTNIIGTDPLPALGEIYNQIVREEQRLASAKSREQQQDAVGFVARQSGSSNPSNSSRGRGGGRGGAGAGRGRGQVTTAHATSSNSSTFPEFSADQWKILTQMIQEKSGSSVSDKLSGKEKLGDVILDIGASHHMKGNLSLLTNIEHISP